MKYLLLTLVFFLPACGPLISNSGVDKAFYVITDDGSVPEDKISQKTIRIIVRDTRGNRFINSHKIVFSEEPSQRGYYQLAQWVDPPTKQLSLMLLERIERSDIAESVTRTGSASVGDMQLNSELLEFYHDIRESPGVVQVRLRAELIDIRNRRILAKKDFVVVEDAESYNAEGAVTAFTLAVNKLLNQLVIWLDEATGRYVALSLSE